jgi:hypothetical protein
VVRHLDDRLRPHTGTVRYVLISLFGVASEQHACRAVAQDDDYRVVFGPPGESQRGHPLRLADDSGLPLRGLIGATLTQRGVKVYRRVV